MKNVPLIIPNFNQLTYLKNLISWWQWYNPDNIVFVVDNASTYPDLLNHYASLNGGNVSVIRYTENNCIKNLREFIDTRIIGEYEYYAISDPDIHPHPTTPMNFLSRWIDYIDSGFHHVGFNLITSDLPAFLNERDSVIANEAEFRKNKVTECDGFNGYKAPIDTTFAVYSTKNSGWHAPMDGGDWGNSLRLFEAFHLGWYVNGNLLNAEMEYYFNTARYRVIGQPSAGSNNNRPKRFINE